MCADFLCFPHFLGVDDTDILLPGDVREGEPGQPASGPEVFHHHPRRDAVHGGSGTVALEDVRLVSFRCHPADSISDCWQSHRLLAHSIIFLFFLGFATKAGILPMGDWLPDAHPVAPSGMSATLSGALVKLGIYGLVRLFCSFLAASPSLRIWGIVLALAGTDSLFVGTLTALRQTDTKRLMAFHTIGQIGYICLGAWCGRLLSGRVPGAGRDCLAGAILHAVNHACFKSCLFLGAGSVLYRTGTAQHGPAGRLGRISCLTPAGRQRSPP